LHEVLHNDNNRANKFDVRPYLLGTWSHEFCNSKAQLCYWLAACVCNVYGVFISLFALFWQAGLAC